MRKFTVVLSHWHLDHVAGTAAFADCEIIANRRTMQHLTRHKAAIEAGTHHGLPAIDPLILPTRLFDGAMQLTLGGREIQLIELNIHSDDATVIWLPASASCWPATRWRTRSPMSASPKTSTAISKIWSGSGRSTRPSSCRTMATPT